MSVTETNIKDKKNFEGSLSGEKIVITKEEDGIYVAHIALPTAEQEQTLKSIPLKKFASADLASLAAAIEKNKSLDSQEKNKSLDSQEKNKSLDSQEKLKLVVPIAQKNPLSEVKRSPIVGQQGLTQSNKSRFGNPQKVTTSDSSVPETPHLIASETGERATSSLNLATDETKQKKVPEDSALQSIQTQNPTRTLSQSSARSTETVRSASAQLQGLTGNSVIPRSVSTNLFKKNKTEVANPQGLPSGPITAYQSQIQSKTPSQETSTLPSSTETTQPPSPGRGNKKEGGKRKSRKMKAKAKAKKTRKH